MKHTKHSRWIGLMMALFLLCTAALPVAALTPAYPITGPYLSSTYYDNLRNLPRTGDKAFDALAVALSQLDYHEGNSTSDFGGENEGGYRNFTEYNHAFGQIGGTYGYAWCASFISWCLAEADAADSAGGLFASCSLWVERLQAIGRYSTRASGYTPKTGDLIFFRSSGVSRASDHVGLVRYVKGGRVYTVEGNSSDRVSLRDYKLTDTYIVGYGRPQYKSAYTLPMTALQSEDKVNGWYTVTNDFVNVRAAASSSATKRGTLGKGDMVRITQIKNGWGCFYYNGKAAYISLDYADFTSPVTYRVTYDGAGGKGAPASSSYWSMEQVKVSEQTPAREGFLFLWWEDAQGKSYAAGEALPTGDVALTAIWEAIPVVEPEPPAGDPDAPGDGGESTPDTEGKGEEFLAPAPEQGSSDILTNTPETGEETNAPAIAAGVITGVLTAALLALWVRKKWPEWKDD